MAAFTYERDAYRKELETEAIAVGEEGGRFWVRTSDTVLYPEGGGQPSDRGTIADVRVLDVQADENGVRHLLEAPVAPGKVRIALDWPRRYDHMQQHTAQHLLTALALARFGWPTTAFHLGPEISDIDLDVSRLAPEDVARLEDEVNREIRAARPVVIRSARRDQMAELGVRSRILPREGELEELRLVEIEGIDLNTCGGTHLRSTAEIGMMTLLGTEPMRGGTRLHFVAGDRVRRRMAVHERRMARLRGLLDTGDDELPEIVELRIRRSKELARSLRRLLEELVEAEADALAARPEAVVAGHWDGRDMDFLQKLGHRLVQVAPAKLALLTAGEGGGGAFVVAAGPSCGLEAAAVGPEVAAVIDGRGGGRGAVFQGKAGRLENREAALALLCDRHGG
jgi:Ser-tRNA(Ala) deacylase AlaX